MIVRLWSVLLLLAFGVPMQAQQLTCLTGVAASLTTTGLLLRDAHGNSTAVSVSAEATVLVLAPGDSSMEKAKAGRLEEIASGDRLIITGRSGSGGFVAVRVIVWKTAAAAAPAPASPGATEQGVSNYQRSLEQQALQKLNGGPDAASEASGSNGSALQGGETAGTDLESRALQAMQTNTAKSQAEAQRRREEEEVQAQEAAALAAASPTPAPTESTAATILNGISGVLGQAATNMQQQNEQQQAQIAQQQQRLQELAALRQQQAEAAAARLRQQQEQAAATRQQQQSAVPPANAGIRQVASNDTPHTTASTGTTGPPTCVYVGGSRGCVPMAEWNAEQQAAAAATKNPTISSDGMTVCPLSGHVTKGHYVACDVYQGQDYTCTPGLQVSIHDDFPNAKGCGAVASGGGGAPSSSSSGGAHAGNDASGLSGPQTADNGSGRHTVAPSCTAVDGKWVRNTTFQTKQDLWLVSLCAEDVSVNWFLGNWNAEAGALHAYETTSATGQGVYPGNSMRLSVYVCPIAYPVPVKADGSKVDGHGERYSCASGNPPGFMEPARN